MALQVKIAQVCVLNFSDHFTRFTTQYKDKPRRVCGILFGTQVGRVLNIAGSFEVGVEVDGKSNEITKFDYKYVQERMTIMKEANFYKPHDVLGWYSNCPDMKPYSKDIGIHKGLYEMNENPVYVTFDPEKKLKGYDLPLNAYEIKFVQQEKTQVETLGEVDFDVDNIKAEIISVEHISKNVASQETSLFADNMSNSVNSLQILQQKIKFLIQYIESNPKVKQDDEFMRMLKEVCINFPQKMNKNYREDIMSEFKETSMINMLTALLVANKTVMDVTHLRPQFDIKTVKAFEDI